MGKPPDPVLFEPGVVLDALARAEVGVIVVGAYAAELRSLPIRSADLDLVPDTGFENLQQLAEVLHELDATVRIRNHKPGPVRLPADGGLIAKVPILDLHVPRAGDVDVIHRAATGGASDGGPLDYRALHVAATYEPVPGARRRALVMSEEDWLAAKRHPPVREKDAAHIRIYESWRRGET